MYETTFEFYMPRNILHKVKVLRYKLKEILKAEYYIDENYVNGNGNVAKYRRPSYSFAIRIIGFDGEHGRKINNKKGKTKGGAIVVKIRTSTELEVNMIEEIKKQIAGKVNPQKRLEEKYWDFLKENRIEVIVDNNDVKRLEPLHSAKILVSSPLFYDLTGAKKQEVREKYTKDKKFDYSIILEELKSHPGELKKQLNTSILCKHKIKDAIFSVDIKDMETAYVQFYKTNKYNNIDNQKGDYKMYLKEKVERIEKLKYEETKEKWKITTLHGLKEIVIKFNPKLSKEDLDIIYVHGLGGKNGLGMGFLWPVEENESGK